MKIKYTIKYRLSSKQKRVTGYIRTPKDLPEGFTSTDAIEHLAAKHSLQDSHPLEINLHNYIHKNISYDKTIGGGKKPVIK